MYQYNDFDRQLVRQRAAQFRDQLTRWQAGELLEAEFKPLRLQNGWYVQRFAPMLRVAVPYGEISSPLLRALARIARDFDHKEDHDTSQANPGLSEVPTLPSPDTPNPARKAPTGPAWRSCATSSASPC